MISSGHEVFLGGKQDLTFGPIVLAGLGGVYVEIFRDVVHRLAPIAAAEASRMVSQMRGGQLLRGVRGQPPADLAALIEVIQRLSQLVCDLPQIREVDINPLKVLPQGQGCLAVDCRMVLSE
jgi:acyl-CoA synthetase (NDP forming)